MTSAFTPTAAQARIIALTDGAHLVVAPPGSGKTGVLTCRIVELIRASPGDPFRILALTFTNKAAETMRLRIEAEIGREWERVTVTTFHAFFLDALQHHGQHIGVESPLTVVESELERGDILAKALGGAGVPLAGQDAGRTIRLLLREIARWKRTLTPPEAVPDDDTAGDVSVRTAYAAYDLALRRGRAVDFDDLLRLGYELFSSAPKVARQYRRIYKYILVDEAQDTSRAQYEALKALCGDEHRNVMLVADIDQSIFRFAGANPALLDAFVRDFDATRHQLHENFRCADAIVRVAGALISHNHDDAGDEGMHSVARARGFVSAATYADEVTEAREVIDLILGLRARGLDRHWLHEVEDPRIDAEDICILGRSRYALDACVSELRTRSEPFAFRSEQTEMFESAGFRFVVRALRLVHNARDLPARAAVLAQIGAAPDVDLPLDGVFGLAEEAGGPVGVLAGRLRAGTSITGSRPGELIRALTRLDGLVDQRAEEDDRELLTRDAASLDERWSLYARTTREPGLGGFLGMLALAGRAAIDEPGIRVLTVHAAKGLEFRAVAMVGLNQGTFPDYRSTNEAGLREERRSAYVAVTRAERWLHLSRPRTRTTPWGAVRIQQASQFVAEMGMEIPEVAPATGGR